MAQTQTAVLLGALTFLLWLVLSVVVVDPLLRKAIAALFGVTLRRHVHRNGRIDWTVAGNAGELRGIVFSLVYTSFFWFIAVVVPGLAALLLALILRRLALATQIFGTWRKLGLASAQAIEPTSLRLAVLAQDAAFQSNRCKAR